MSDGRKLVVRLLSMSALALGLAGASLCLSASAAFAQSTDQYIPAFAAFAAGCNSEDISDDTDIARADPEWAAIIHDPAHVFPDDPPTILEGFVGEPSPTERSKDQAPAEVAEEDLMWNHFTHDETFKVVPDPAYQHLLSSWVNDDGTIGVHTDMEVEWDSASTMEDNRTWGAMPEFVWPSVYDRVWVEGRWIFDCGHPGSNDLAHAKYSTEIHPPRAVATFRLNHPALSSLVPSLPASWLPVTGAPATLAPDAPNGGPTQVPVTEADVFVSGNGGGINDYCSDFVTGGCVHNSTVIKVNDRNYVFDVYPPGTDYQARLGNGTFQVTPPQADASLQWRVVDQSDQIPGHACGVPDKSACVTVTPLLCLVDASTPPPDQTESSCPPVPATPTRLRVILPFAGSQANVFAQSILLGWDSVPAPSVTAPVRTFNVSLHELTVVHNGESFLHDGDWRVFVGVGGQWRYMSSIFDRNSSGDNVCHGDALTENGDGDCFRFDNTPWRVSVQDGTPIHVAVGGWESDSVDSDFCRGGDFGWPFACNAGILDLLDLATANNDRVGTYEFDLSPANGYAPPAPYTTERLPDGEQYTVEFRVGEFPAATPAHAQLGVGDPHYTDQFGQTFVAPSTPLTLSSPAPDADGFQYRFRRQGAPLPTYASPLPFPVHWTRADLPSGSSSVQVSLGGSGADGQYDVQYAGETFAHLLEPRQTGTLDLDSTPPAETIVQPQATAYPHSAVLTLDYSVDDGSGSGVATTTPTLDGAASLDGHGLQSGQAIDLLTELALGAHTFAVGAADNLGNSGTSSVTFTIVVTPDSIKDDVRYFLQSGAIKSAGEASSLLAKLDAAARARASGDCNAAANIYQAFINELQAQAGKGVDAAAAQIMIADAQYLIVNCP